MSESNDSPVPPPAATPSDPNATRYGPTPTADPAATRYSDRPTDAPASVGPWGRSGLPGYEILGELGRGGMGIVYKARQPSLNRVVALKTMLAGANASDEDVYRFRSEAQAAARLQHPNIVQIFEVSQHNGLPYILLEFVGGGSLAKRLGGKPLPPRPAAGLVETLARAVAHAHSLGVVHRDLKPSNVLLTANGVPKITDFGLAKQLDGPPGQTRSGAVMGTPSYMPPEQARGLSRKVGPAADLYALGAVLYELLTGRPPFKAPTDVDTLLLVLNDEPEPPRRRRPQVPRDAETICLKCLHKEPGKRYAGAEALADDLHRFLNGSPIQARRTPPWERAARWVKRRSLAAVVVILAAVLLLATGAWLWRWGANPGVSTPPQAEDKTYPYTLKVRFEAPVGMRISWQVEKPPAGAPPLQPIPAMEPPLQLPGNDRGEPFRHVAGMFPAFNLEAPASYSFRSGGSYRLKFDFIPKFPELEVYPVLEVRNSPSAEGLAALGSTVLPIRLSDDDLALVNKGNGDMVFKAWRLDPAGRVVELEPGGQASATDALVFLHMGNIDIKAPIVPPKAEP